MECDQLRRGFRDDNERELLPENPKPEKRVREKNKRKGRIKGRNKTSLLYVTFCEIFLIF